MTKEEKWEMFNKNKGSYPKWPNETMLKVFFGNYLKKRIDLKPDLKVLDVGCGFGNNLKPFLDLGYDCHGTEITDEMAKQTQEIISKEYKNITIKKGTNLKLPYPDNTFDILTSISVIHYESSEEDLISAVNEYSRVLKDNGVLFLITGGEKHEIVQNARLVAPHIYEIKNYDFRDGNKMFFFDNEKYLEYYLKDNFADIETGKVTEELMKRTLEFLVVVGRKSGTK